MRTQPLFLAIAALAFAPIAQCLNILVNNDDGWAAANIRELYRLLKASGHNVLLVAPVVDNSGQGGRSVFTNLPTLTTNGEFNSVAAGAPSLGSDPADSHLWYYNGTPAACTFVNLDFVVPKVWGNSTNIDLLVAGPNVGQNLGPFLYTLSGTIGATYAAVGRGIPAIAFSGGSLYGQRGYQEINKTTPSGFPDPATIYAQLSVSLVNQLANNTRPGKRLLPLGYGLNVNYPSITSLTNASCVAPPFIQTRLTGGAFSDFAAYNATSQTFSFQNILGAGLNACINGDCSLPGETTIVGAGCQSAVSVFTVDYDAPATKDEKKVRSSLQPLVKYQKGNHYPEKRGDTLKTGPRRHE